MHDAGACQRRQECASRAEEGREGSAFARPCREREQGHAHLGKFEVEDGKLQLSVYTAEGTNYSEVIVDHKTGKVKESKAITSDDDLTAAKAQAVAMASAKTSLKATVDKAVKATRVTAR